ncbi:MAG: tetratricopeptide repeat protein [Planctomycetota bacterium]
MASSNATTGNDTAKPLLHRVLSEAEGYLELGMTEHALQALQRRGKLVHGSARGCYLLGETLRELSRHSEAIFPLRRSAKLEPEDIHVWLALGWCYKRTGALGDAIDALQQALRHEPGEAILHYNLACYWSLAGDRSHAMDHLAKSLHIDGNYRDLIADEPDFDFLREDQGFRLLTSVIV